MGTRGTGTTTVMTAMWTAGTRTTSAAGTGAQRGGGRERRAQEVRHGGQHDVRPAIAAKAARRRRRRADAGEHERGADPRHRVGVAHIALHVADHERARGVQPPAVQEAPQ